MNRICEKRILKELNILKKNQIDENIYLHFPSKNKIKVLIIGQEGTPYHNGFFFFDIKIPVEYPFRPPIFKFKTIDSKKNVRFNPNLYKNGKICLSIINTWDGPKWSPCNTISSTILSISSMVLVKDALKNEPGYEKESENIITEYDDAIKYASLDIGVLDMLENTPYGFYYFKKIIKNYFIKNYDWYKTQCVNKKNSNYRNKLFNMNLDIDYKKLNSRFEETYENINKINKIESK
jgi:ubiquitin-conjugating enzyme E2 Z